MPKYPAKQEAVGEVLDDNTGATREGCLFQREVQLVADRIVAMQTCCWNHRDESVKLRLETEQKCFEDQLHFSRQQRT
jgi:tartrate dehydratase alpha subunit/fumarate hydratase class I-like protein